MFKPVSPKVNVQAVEAEQLAFWKTNDIFHKTMEEREGNPSYVIYEGPPTANGKPGTHHVLARAFKDIFPRYKTMQGFYVLRKGGWDTHGLPVEIGVEKELGLEHKWQIEDYGIAPFNEKCRESVFRFIKEWEELTERIAYWTDLDTAYVTYKNEYIESVWWILRQMWDQGLVYRGYKVVPYCPRCGTPLSSHEVNLGYVDDTPDPSVFVRFKIKERENTYFLVWTTTPWTLPGNVALAVGEDIDYVEMKQEGHDPEETLILAKDLVDRVFEAQRSHYQVVREMKGSDLLGLHYEPLFAFLTVDRDYCYVVKGDFVSTEDGTGIVHIAPAFGADDMEVGRTYNLPVLQTVAPDGGFIEDVTPWAGIWVKDADSQIIEELENRGLMFKHGTYYHTYPFCWRCDTPLLYYSRPTWYIRTTARRDDLVNLNKTINWVPEHIKEGRFGNWLEGNIDWALGRERYWGTPLPVWQCDNPECQHEHMVSGRDELSKLAGKDYSELDLHRPYVDEVVWTCHDCGSGTMRRVPELIDVWFDSGAMPVAQWGYPYRNQEMFKSQFPADYICEAIDQTRGWFYSLHAISTLLFREVCFKNVICLGLILDEEGKKMSKSRGNVVDPWDVLNKYGADMFRWYMFTAGPPGEMRRFSVELVGQSYRSFWLTLWNTYSFFVTYANLDGFLPSDKMIPVNERGNLDRWILSELNSLVKRVTEAFDEYDVPNATRPIEQFIDTLSNWYLRRSRRRFWKSENDTDKKAAYQTLYEVLVTVSKLLAPSIPFLAEEIFRNLASEKLNDEPVSVHLSRWPVADETLIDLKLNEEMDMVMRLVSLGHAARNNAGIKVRQPLSSVAFSVPSGPFSVIERYRDIIAEELNVKNVVFLADADEYVSYSLNPLPKELGPRFGKDFPAIQQALREGDQKSLARTLLSGKPVSVMLHDQTQEITPAEVEVRTTPSEGYAIAEDNQILAALNITIDEALGSEGLAREVIRRIQVMRKDADFNVDDRIAVRASGTKKVLESISAFKDLIMAETLATILQSSDEADDSMTLQEFDGETLYVNISRKS